MIFCTFNDIPASLQMHLHVFTRVRIKLLDSLPADRRRVLRFLRMYDLQPFSLNLGIHATPSLSIYVNSFL